jgi:hypothetical protein
VCYPSVNRTKRSTNGGFWEGQKFLLLLLG